VITLKLLLLLLFKYIFADEAHDAVKSSSAMLFLRVYLCKLGLKLPRVMCKNRGHASVALITGFSTGKTKISKSPFKPSEET